MGRLLPLAAALVTGSMLVAACDGKDADGATTLMNGSQASELSVDLEGVGDPSVLTSVTVSRIGEIEAGSTVATCLQRAGDDRPVGPIVVRVGASAESVTFRDKSLRGLYACDNTEGPRDENRPWCGGAFGQLFEGRLRDPRLDIGACSTRDGKLLGFAWVQPDPGVKYVVVEQSGYVEVYETAGGLPVRVTTSNVEIERSRAIFNVFEHASDGRMIREYQLKASVAG